MDSDSVVPVYVSSSWKGAHQWTGPGRQAFLCGCLASLAKNIDHIGGRLIFRRGGVRAELENLINESQAEAIYLNRDPDPYGREVEKSIRELCREKGIGFHDFQDVVLHEPHEVLTGTGNPYKVYTPYSRTWFAQEKPGVVETVRKMVLLLLQMVPLLLFRMEGQLRNSRHQRAANQRDRQESRGEGLGGLPARPLCEGRVGKGHAAGSG